MAIFASTTTSGYSDPLRAQSIKALEQRLRDQQTQMAQQQPDAAMMGTIPGGIGHVLGKIGGRMREARSEQALAANRDAFEMWGFLSCGKGDPMQLMAVGHGCAPSRFRDVEVGSSA